MLVLTRKISLSKLGVRLDCDFEGNICQIIALLSNRVILNLKTKDFNMVKKSFVQMTKHLSQHLEKSGSQLSKVYIGLYLLTSGLTSQKGPISPFSISLGRHF